MTATTATPLVVVFASPGLYEWIVPTGGGQVGGGGSSFGPPGTVFQNGIQTGNGQVIITYTP